MGGHVKVNASHPRGHGVSGSALSSLSKVRGSTPPCVWRTSLGEHFTPLWADPVRAWISMDQRPRHRVVYTKKKKRLTPASVVLRQSKASKKFKLFLCVDFVGGLFLAAHLPILFKQSLRCHSTSFLGFKRYRVQYVTVNFCFFI